MLRFSNDKHRHLQYHHVRHRTPLRRWILSTTLLAVILYVLILQTLSTLLHEQQPFFYADAVTLDPTISIYDFTSTNDTVAETGTTLKVLTMLEYGVYFGRDEVAFTAIRTLFLGPFIIDLPTVPADWTLPLRVLIRDGRSTDTDPQTGGLPLHPPLQTFIHINGHLSLGSNISIVGGSYDYNDALILSAVSELVINGGSVFIVRGLTLRTHWFEQTANVVYCTKGVNISDSNSSFIVSSNLLFAIDQVVTSQWQWYIVRIRDHLTVTTGGTLSISNNDFIVRNVTTRDDWRLYVLVTYINTPVLIQSSGSQLIVANNTQATSNLVWGQDCKLYVVYITDTTLTIESGGSFHVFNNTEIMSNLSNLNNTGVAGEWIWSTFFVTTLFIRNESSLLSITHNTKTLISTNLVGNAPSTVAILTATDVGIDSGANILLESNTLEMESDSNILMVTSSIKVGLLGTVVLRHNSISNGGYLIYMSPLATLMMTPPPIATPTTATVQTCANYVHGSSCSSGRSGGSSGGRCLNREITGAGQFSQCTQTLSATMLGTSVSPIVNLSESVSHRTKSQTITKSNPATNSSTPTSSPINTPSAIPTKSTTAGTASHTLACPNNLENQMSACTYALSVHLGNTTTTATSSSSANSSSSSTVVVCSDEARESTKEEEHPLTIDIPFSMWSSSGGSSGNNPFFISVRLIDALTGYYMSSSTSTTKNSSPNTDVSGISYFSRISIKEEKEEDGGELWAVVSVSNTGLPYGNKKIQSITLAIPLLSSFRCAFLPLSTHSNEHGEIRVVLALQPDAVNDKLPPGVVAVLDAAVAVSTFNGVVRAGMMNSVIGMLKCMEFDPLEEVGFINNPFNWAAGREALQFYRGSVITSLISILTISVCIILALVIVKLLGTGKKEGVRTWTSSLEILRLPSLPLVAVLLLSEVSISSSTSMIFYSESDEVDVVLGLMSTGAMFGYMGVYIYQTAARSKKFIEVKAVKAIIASGGGRGGDSEDGVSTSSAKAEDGTLPTTSDDSSGAQQQKRLKPHGSSLMGRLFRYAFEPTHEVVILLGRSSNTTLTTTTAFEPTHEVVILLGRSSNTTLTNTTLGRSSNTILTNTTTASPNPTNCDDNVNNILTDNDDDSSNGNIINNNINDDHNGEDAKKKKIVRRMGGEDGEAWLRRNYYFVADRRWAAYGAIEVIGGTMTNMLEGIPLTTTSRTLCIARPLCALIITAGLLALLVWKTPNAVRIEQWCSVFVMGGILLTTTLVFIHSISPSDTLELVTGYIGTVVMAASIVLSVVELVVILMTYVPSLKSMMNLRSSNLQSVIDRSNEIDEINKNNDKNNNDEMMVPLLLHTDDDDGNSNDDQVPNRIVAVGIDHSDKDNDDLQTTPPPELQHHNQHHRQQQQYTPLHSDEDDDVVDMNNQEEEEEPTPNVVMWRILAELEEYEREETQRLQNTKGHFGKQIRKRDKSN